MRTPLLLLKIIGKVALHASGVGGLWSIVVEDVPELANNVWNEWKAARTPAERRADLEAVALLDNDVALDVDAILAEIAADQPASVREELAAYLAQVPASVRQTLRRPADPTGRTVPPALEPRSGRDLIPFLAAQKPRFKAGDRPIPGVDWVLAELLGIGGYGEVWKARHAHIDDFEPVALKFCIDPQARERLLKHEAKLCARVQREGRHPGIVALRNTYLSADPPCLEYEFVEGGTLAGLIQEWSRRETPPTLEEVTRHLLAIAEVVAFAHRLDPPIVHRDLKPANILVRGLNGSTRFLITDFGIGGIATAAVIRATRQPTRPSLLLTQAVSGSHTPLYASPEQARGGDPDPRDDVHALGVIWYQMITKDLTAGPPGGSSWRRKLIARGMAPELVDVLDSCLNEAIERPADAAAFCERIKETLPHVECRFPSLAVPSTYSASSIQQVSSVRLATGETSVPSGNLKKWNGESQYFKGHIGRISALALSADIRSALSGGSDNTIRLWNLASGREVRCFEARKGPVLCVAFSPDGRSALSGGEDDGTVRLWDVASGREVLSFNEHSEEVWCVAFAPDGRLAISGGHDGTARLWKVDSGQEVACFEGSADVISSVTFSPDGRFALCGTAIEISDCWM